MTTTEKPSPIEVWLTQQNMAITCMVVHEDESVKYEEVESLSMRGAMREVTGYFVRQGYRPAGRWESETDDRGDDLPGEHVRQFKLKEGS